MVFIFPFLVLLFRYGDADSFVLSDVKYTVANCSFTGTDNAHITNMPNRLAMINITSDMMAETLTFTMDLLSMPLFSCRACDLSPSYCGHTLQPSQVIEADDVQFNFRIVAIQTETGQAFPTNVNTSIGHFNWNTGRIELSMLDDLQLTQIRETTPSGDTETVLNYCDQQLQFIIVLYITVELPSPRDLLSVVHKADNSLPILCNATQEFFDDIDCSGNTLQFYAVPFTPQACFHLYTPSSESLYSTLPNFTIHSSLYWYNTFLTQPQMSPFITPLCGYNVSDLMLMSNLYHVKCDNLLARSLLVLTPWYQLALELFTLRLNLEQSGLSLSDPTLASVSFAAALATDLLGRNCAQKNTLLFWASPSYTNFQTMITLISTYNTITGNNSNTGDDTLCTSLAQYFASIPSMAPVEPVAPWYFKVFGLFLYPDDNMERKALAILSIFTLLPLSVLVCYLLTLWRRHRQKSQCDVVLY